MENIDDIKQETAPPEITETENKLNEYEKNIIHEKDMEKKLTNKEVSPDETPTSFELEDGLNNIEKGEGILTSNKWFEKYTKMREDNGLSENISFQDFLLAQGFLRTGPEIGTKEAHAQWISKKIKETENNLELITISLDKLRNTYKVINKINRSEDDEFLDFDVTEEQEEEKDDLVMEYEGIMTFSELTSIFQSYINKAHKKIKQKDIYDQANELSEDNNLKFKIFKKLIPYSEILDDEILDIKEKDTYYLELTDTMIKLFKEFREEKYKKLEAVDKLIGRSVLSKEIKNNVKKELDAMDSIVSYAYDLEDSK